MQFDKLRRALVRKGRKGTPSTYPIKNLMRPRKGEQWEHHYKAAMAKLAQDLLPVTESDRMKDILTRIGNYWDERNPEMFQKFGDNVNEWVNKVASDPTATAQVLYNFGAETGSPQFQHIASVIDQGPARGLGGAITDPSQTYFESAEPDPTGEVAGGRRGLLVGEGINTALNALATRMPGRVGDIANIAGALGAGAAPALLRPNEQVLDRPSVTPLLKPLEARLGTLEAAHDLDTIADIDAPDDKTIARLQDRLAKAIQAENAAMAEAPDFNVYAQAARSRLREQATGAALQALNQPVDAALSPKLMAGLPVAMEVATEVFGNPTANPKLYANILNNTRTAQTTDEDIVGNYVLRPVETPQGVISAGTLITPQLQGQLQGANVSDLVIATPESGIQALNRYGTTALNSLGTWIGGKWAQGQLPNLFSKVPGSAQRVSAIGDLTKVRNPLSQIAGRVGGYGATLLGGLSSKQPPKPGAKWAAKAARLLESGKLGPLAKRSLQALGTVGKGARFLKTIPVVGSLMNLGTGAWELGQWFTEGGRERIGREVEDLREQKWLAGMERSELESLGEGALDVAKGAFLGDVRPAQATLTDVLGKFPGMGGNKQRADFLRKHRLHQKIEEAKPEMQARLQQALPGLLGSELEHAATAAAINRVTAGQQEFGRGTTEEVSPIERNIDRWGAELTPAAKENARQLVRMVGDDVFRDLFFYPEEMGGTPYTAAWQALDTGAQQGAELDASFGGKLSYADPQESKESKLRTRRAKADRQQLRQQQLQQHSAETQRLRESLRRTQERQKALPAQQREFAQQQEQAEAGISSIRQQRLQETGTDHLLDLVDKRAPYRKLPSVGTQPATPAPVTTVGRGLSQALAKHVPTQVDQALPQPDNVAAPAQPSAAPDWGRAQQSLKSQGLLQ